MKQLTLLLLAFGVLLSSTVLAQTDSLSKKFEYSEISIQFGNLSAEQGRLSTATALQLAPQSIFLNTLTGYQQSVFYNYYSPSFTLGGHIGFTLPKKSHHSLRPTLRFGLLYNKSDILSAQYSRLTAVTVDSLTNSDGLVTQYIQDANQETVDARYSSDQLFLDANLTYAINAQGRFSMYMGVGLGGGVLFNAQTTVSYLNTSFTQTISPVTFNGSSRNFVTEASQEETFRNRAGFAALAYFPLGFNFRIGKRNEAWRKAHAFFEFRPGVLLQVMPEANLNLLRSTMGSQFGFRFDLR